jgi:phosphoglycerate kinase
MLSLKDLDLREKTVFLRVDFNVPLEKNGTIRNDSRIKAALPTLEVLFAQKTKVIIASHFGRPKGKFVPELSLKPVALRLGELIPREVILAPDVIGDKVDTLKENLKQDQVLLLENLRFHPGEKSNDEVFAGELAKGIDVYINDAFGACHRAHASVVGITSHVEKAAAGLLVSKELEYLSKAVFSPERPYTAILGGVKVSDKLPVIENLLKKADNILIGGAMAYTFFKSMGYDVGASKVEENDMGLAKMLLKKAEEKNVKIHLPQDHIAATALDAEAEAQTIEQLPIPSDMMGLDIGPETIAEYSNILSKAKTIFWNGPMGVFEIEKFSIGTTKIAEAVAESSAISIIGGGDSVAAVYKAGVSEKISHISTGGGASLEYIANETLPGIEALSEK